MNEREKLLQQLNDNYEVKKQEYDDVKPYKATTNFNTALNKPRINVNEVTNVNIQGNEMINKAMGIDNLMESPTQNVADVNAINQASQNINIVNIPDQQSQIVNSQGLQSAQTNTNVNNNAMEQQVLEKNLDVTERFYQDQPVYDMQSERTTTYISNMDNVPKKRTIKFTISKDTQVLLLMVVIIFIFILILPVLSDFIKNIKNN